MRPYPVLVDGVDDLLSDDDDQLVSVSCGARYTLAMARSKRAFVWGQVAPLKEYSSGEGNEHSYGSTNSSSRNRGAGHGKGCSLGSCSRPRELKPAGLIHAGRTADPSSTGGGKTGRCCGDVGSAAVFDAATAWVGGGTGVVKHGYEGDSRWRVSAVGCGPWYIVFGLEDGGQQGQAGQLEVAA